MYQSIWCSVLFAFGGITSAFAQSPVITEYQTDYQPGNIVSGPDGNLWFTLNSGACSFGICPPPLGIIGKITPAGTISQYPIPTVLNYPASITAGPDGNLWFTERGTSQIGKITPAGVITEFPVPSTESTLGGITLGPDGNLWFTEFNMNAATGNNIGRITPAGVVTEFPGVTAYPQYIANGPDGNLWATEYAISCGIDTCVPKNATIARISPAGVVTEFPVVTSNSVLNGIARGPDGNLWFCEDLAGLGPDNYGHFGANIGKISPKGIVAEYAVPTASSAPYEITSGPDGNVWFTESNANQIGRVTPSGVITEYATVTANSGPYGIATGPDGNLWFTEFNADKIAKLVPSFAISSGITGNWYDPAQSGQGFSIEVLPGNTLLAEWFVYAPNGGQAWIVGTGPIIGNTAQIQGYQKVGAGGRFPPEFDPSQLQDQFWGTITFSFTDCNDGTVNWQPTAVGYTAGSIAISRLTMPVGLTCP